MNAQTKDKGGWRAWIRLLRAPNLFTVPGDVLAGCAVAAVDHAIEPARLFAALVASLCLYASGLIMNDLVDEKTDRRERPSRPIAATRS